MQKPIAPDTFVAESFRSTIAGRVVVEWNYRDAAGELHAGIARSLEEAEAAACRRGYRLPKPEAGGAEAIARRSTRR